MHDWCVGVDSGGDAQRAAHVHDAERRARCHDNQVGVVQLAAGTHHLDGGVRHAHMVLVLGDNNGRLLRRDVQYYNCCQC